MQCFLKVTMLCWNFHNHLFFLSLVFLKCLVSFPFSFFPFVFPRSPTLVSASSGEEIVVDQVKLCADIERFESTQVQSVTNMLRYSEIAGVVNC